MSYMNVFVLIAMIVVYQYTFLSYSISDQNVIGI